MEIKRMYAGGGDRTHVLRISDLIRYIPSCYCCYMKILKFVMNRKKFPVKDIFYHLLLFIFKVSNLFNQKTVQKNLLCIGIKLSKVQ